MKINFWHTICNGLRKQYNMEKERKEIKEQIKWLKMFALKYQHDMDYIMNSEIEDRIIELEGKL